MENPPAARHRLKIGLIADSPVVSRYDHELAAWARSELGSQLVLVRQTIPPQFGPKGKLAAALDALRRRGLVGLVTAVLWFLVRRVEALKLPSAGHPAHTATGDLTPLVDAQIVVEPVVSPSGLVYRYRDADLERLRRENFDVLIRMGSGILKGDILSCSRLGILSFHHGDNRVNRGGPPGFWEVYAREPESGFVIQQLTEELDAGNVVARGATSTRSFFLANQANLYERGNHAFKQLLRAVAASGQLPPFEERLPYFNRLYREPDFAQLLKYIARQATSVLRNRYKQKVRGQVQRWGVAYQARSWRNLVMWRATRIANPPGRFFADPFVVSRDGAHYCFVEDYDYATRRGCISVLKLGDAGAEWLGHALAEPFHLSYPSVFEYAGRVYMVPECHEQREIRIYECEQFPLRWSLKCVAMKDVSAAETLVFEHQGRWWMLTNIDPTGGSDHGSELWLFHADSPLSAQWAPHPRNPVCRDPSNARNGGILFEGGRIFRVAQRSTFEQYGAGASIFRIDRIDAQDYEETLVTRIEPHFFDNLLGVHHLHSDGEITVFDFVAEERPR